LFIPKKKRKMGVYNMALRTVPNMKGKVRKAFINDFIGRRYFRMKTMLEKYGVSFLIGAIIVLLIIALILK
jgi:hypothetical protein